MPDLTDAEFSTALRAAAEAQPEEGGTTSDTEPEPENVEETPVSETQEPEQEQPEAEAEAKAEEAEQKKWADRFTSPEELEKGYQELTEKLTEQGSELGELRQLREQLDSLREQVQQPQQQQQPINQSTVDWLDEQVAQNPYGATVWALQNDPSGVLYERAMDGWYEMQPRQAAAFERQMERQQIEQQMQQQMQPLADQAARNDFNTAWAQTKQSIPDIDNFADAIVGVAETAPEIVEALKSGSLADKQRVLENLYWLAKGRQANTLQEAAQAVAAQQQTETRAAKQNATVATASSSQAREGNAASDDEEALLKWKQGLIAPSPTSFR